MSAPAAFGLGSGAVGPHRLGRTGAVVVTALVVVALGAATAAAVLGRPTSAVHATAYGGSAVIDDALGGPVVVDLADALPTLRLEGVATDVGAADEADVEAVPLSDGTLLVDDVTGTVNFVDPDQLVVASQGAGVALPGPAGAVSATAYPDGDDAFVVRQGPNAAAVSLVGRTTVAVAALLQSSSGTGPSSSGSSSGPGSSGSGSSGSGSSGSSPGGPGVPATVPVGTATLPPLLAGGAGTAVAAGGRLWALVQPAGRRPHVALVSPPRRPGGPLVVTDTGHVVASQGTGTTSGTGSTVPAALATTGGRRPAVVLATATGLTVLAGQPDVPGGHRLRLRMRRMGRVREVVPVADTDGRALFAYEGTRGWFLAGVDLASGRVTGPTALRGTAGVGLTAALLAAGGSGSSSGGSAPAGASGGSAPVGASGGGAVSSGPQLVDPVADGGVVYALASATDGGRPVLVRVDPSSGRVAPVHLPGDPTGVYPLVGPAEQPVWAGEQVLAEGPRVVVNNPDSELAVVLFTAGRPRAVVVDKGDAVDIDPAAPPADLVAAPGAGSSAPGSTPSPGSGSAPSPTQLVDPALACRTTTQKPNVPQVDPPQPATHAVSLSWTYPLIDSADCEPSSYTVTVTALGGAAQPADPTVDVTGQTAVTVTGLLSDTTYAFVVTAYINQGSTSAPAVEATTAAEGPDAAASVTTTANGSTGWDVAWQPCTAGCTSTEPVAAWMVSAAACAGSFVGQLPSEEVPAGDDSTTVLFSSDPGLVGTSLSFSVQPIGADGLLGDPTGDGACTEGWTPPQADQISLDVAEPPAPAGSALATLTVAPPPGAADASVYGSEETEFVYTLGGQSQGPTTDDEATFAGLQPGTAYPTSVTVYPAGHPEAAVTIDGPPAAPTEPWPADLAVTATGQTTSFLSGSVTATITDAFGDVPGGAAESLQAAGSVLCGEVETPVEPTTVTPVAGSTDGQVTVPLSLADGELGASCTLTLTLSEVGTDYHGGSSPPLAAGFATSAPGTVSATWDPPPTAPYTSGSDVEVTATGEAGGVTGWTASVVGPPGCTASAVSPGADGSVVLDVTPCVAAAVQAMEAAGQSSATFDVTVAVTWTVDGVQEVEDVAAPPETLTAPGAGTASSGTGSSGAGSSGVGSSGTAAGSSARVASGAA